MLYIDFNQLSFLSQGGRRMLKNILRRGITSLLVIMFVITSFGTGAKSANSAAAPAIFALSLIVGSIVGHAGSTKQGGYYTYRNKPFPAPVKSGPHYVQRLDTHFLVDTREQIWLGNNNTAEWLLQKTWEDKNRKKVEREDLNVGSYP
jgi:hypothetical protein